MLTVRFTHTLVLLALSLVLSLSASPVLAQSESEDDTTATQSSILDDRAAEELGKRIQKALEEKREQVKGVIDQLMTEKKAMIGEVQRVTDEAITITSPTGTNILTLDNVALLKQDATIDVDDIAVGNWVTVLGNREKNSIEPEYILVSTESLRPKPQTVLIGTVTAVTRTSITVQPRAQEDTSTFAVAQSTEIQDSDGTAATVSEITEDITVLITSSAAENGTPTASTIRSLAPLE